MRYFLYIKSDNKKTHIIILLNTPGEERTIMDPRIHIQVTREESGFQVLNRLILLLQRHKDLYKKDINKICCCVKTNQNKMFVITLVRRRIRKGFFI